MSTKPSGQTQVNEKLAIGEHTTYRGYEIHHEDKREYVVYFAANGLKAAKQVIDWMIWSGCLKKE